MAKDNSSPPVMSIGTSSLTVVFLVLALATFAVLTLSGAKSDFELSQRLADHKAAYYTASTRAEEILAAVDAGLAKDQLPTEVDGIPVTREGDLLSWQVPMSDTQALSVALLITDPTVSEHYYRILSWQVVQTGTWQGSDSAGLMEFD